MKFVVYNEATGKYLNPTRFSENEIGELVFPEQENITSEICFATFKDAGAFAQNAYCSNMFYDEIFVKEI